MPIYGIIINIADITSFLFALYQCVHDDLAVVTDLGNSLVDLITDLGIRSSCRCKLHVYLPELVQSFQLFSSILCCQQRTEEGRETAHSQSLSNTSAKYHDRNIVYAASGTSFNVDTISAI